jgi:DNA-binding transcriptional regulator GbsR (MarR family)
MHMAEFSPVSRKFILHWGEMGARWGINRTVAQVHALLYISPQPLNAEQIVQALGVARSNVSTSLKELLGWGVIRVIHILGDRRDYFESLQDVWEMFRTILDQRMKREIDPTLSLLRDCVAEANRKGAAEAVVRDRICRLLDFFQSMTGWYEQIRRLPIPAVMRFVKMGSRVRRWIGLAGPASG